MKDLIAFGDDTEVSRNVPESFLLLKKGSNKFTVNGKVSEFSIGEDEMDSIVQEFNSRDKDLVIDYDHSTLNKETSFTGDAPASGWAKLEKTTEGVIAKVLNWTDKARQRMLDGEYRYFSPVVRFDDGTKKPCAVQSVGLTNHPAVHSSMALVACSDMFETEDKEVTDKKNMIEDYKSVVNKAKRAIDNMQVELNDGIKAMSTIAGEDKAMQADLQSFSDSLFSSNFTDADGKVIALSDVTNEFTIVTREVANADELKSWIDNKVKELSDKRSTVEAMKQEEIDSDIAFLNNEKNKINAEMAKEKSATDNVEDLIDPTDPAVQLNDGIEVVKVVAVDPINETDITDEASIPEETVEDEEVFTKIQAFIQKLQAVSDDIDDIREQVVNEFSGKFRKGFPMRNFAKNMVCPMRKSIENAEIIQQMSDIDLTEKSTRDDIISNIKSLNDFKQETSKAFTDLGVEDVKGLIQKFSDVEIKHKTDNATALVDNLINQPNCKISESMKPWAIKFATKDLQAFNDFIADAPVIFSKVPEIGTISKVPEKQFSKAQLEVSKIFGNKPSDIF